MKQPHRITCAFATLAASVLLSSPARATPYLQTDLVSDVPGLAQLTDASLKNPWGMSFTATSPFWISDQATSSSTLYRVTNGIASKVALTVSIPTTGSLGQGPTGQVANTAGAAFFVNGTPSSFIFANLNGTISAWTGSLGTTAAAVVTSNNVYTGLALSGTGANAKLYAASSNGIDVFNSSFNPLLPAFVNNDPAIAGLVPFNVQTIGSSVYVTYAPPGRAAQTGAAEGSGAVAVFDTNGTLIRTLVSGGKLAAPWGVTLAPSTFGSFGGDLLVGNFSYAVAEINAFDPVSGAYLGTIGDQLGDPLINAGLWGIAFGNGASGDANTLYFNAGINNEADGLFGSIKAIPEPESVLLMIGGLGAALVAHRRRRPA